MKRATEFYILVFPTAGKLRAQRGAPPHQGELHFPLKFPVFFFLCFWFCFTAYPLVNFYMPGPYCKRTLILIE